MSFLAGHAIQHRVCLAHSAGMCHPCDAGVALDSDAGEPANANLNTATADMAPEALRKARREIRHLGIASFRQHLMPTAKHQPTPHANEEFWAVRRIKFINEVSCASRPRVRMRRSVAVFRISPSGTQITDSPTAGKGLNMKTQHTLGALAVSLTLAVRVASATSSPDFWIPYVAAPVTGTKGGKTGLFVIASNAVGGSTAPAPAWITESAPTVLGAAFEGFVSGSPPPPPGN